MWAVIDASFTSLFCMVKVMQQRIFVFRVIHSLVDGSTEARGLRASLQMFFWTYEVRLSLTTTRITV